MSARMTTAQVLGSLHRELKEEGVPEELVHEIVRDAARQLTAQMGVGVKDAAEVSA